MALPREYGFMAPEDVSLDFEYQDVPLHAPGTGDAELGEYVVIGTVGSATLDWDCFRCLVVRDACSKQAYQVAVVYADTCVDVVEIKSVIEDDLVYARILEPSGYVALKDLSRGASYMVTKRFRDISRKHFAAMFKNIFFAGLGNFAFAPAGYIIAKMFSHWLLLSLLVFAQVISGAFLQRRAMKALESFVAEVGSSYYLPYLLAKHNAFRLCGIRIGVQSWVVGFIFGQLEYIDPTLDAATAGKANSLLSPKARDAFARTWRHLPLDDGGILDTVAEAIADMNLEGTLLVIVVVSFCFQLLGFFLNAARISGSGFSVWPELSDQGAEACRRRVRFWGWLGGMAECASLGGVADVAGKMLVAELNVMAQLGVVANALASSTPILAKIIAKILLEAFPSAWFTISLLALTRNFLHVDSDKLILTSFSICSSLLVISMLGCDLVYSIYLTIPRRSISFDRDLAALMVGATVKIGLLSTMLAAWLSLVARFVGVFACPMLFRGTGQFSIISVSCTGF